MSRRRRDDPFIIEYAQQFESLPWWAGLTAAILFIAVSFVLPHLVGGAPLAAVVAMFGQWFLWLLAGATVLFTASGVVRRALDRRRFDHTEDVGRLDPYQYERYVAEYYRRVGYSVTQRGGAGPDGGVDLAVTKGGERLLVQCKHWKAWSVGPQPLRELWGLVDHEKATGAVFITSKVFTVEARAFATGKRLELIDGKQLGAMIAAIKSGTSATTADTPLAVEPASVPSCPACGSPMVVRTAHRGPRSGERFFGCSTYPKCHGVLPLAPEPAPPI
jgi:restriction system protein